MSGPVKVTCHCGAVELSVYLKDGLGAARRCDCSYCRRRGTPTASVARADLRIVKGEDNLTLYSFGTHTAKHYFCKICGIYTHHQRRSDPDQYGVNMGCIEGVNPRDFEPIGWHDGVNHPSDQ
ncbi:MAG: GFA family protein [Marivita sp.]|uniref:GFA family protein n=1 Tax=Marivita sp. TaxID=2003365 RepID=UPI001B0138F8|nr:GFA family protein [Marivita sp.]MBO6882110.1 GFA family protein [Marivita sp.]